MVVLAPASIQEIVDLTGDAFDIADRYRTPVMIMGDGMLGQMMEPVTFENVGKEASDLPEKTWATDGTHMKRKKNIINSLYLQPEDLEKLVLEREKRYEVMKEKEVRYEADMLEDAEYVFVAYGTTARIVKNAIKSLRAEGYKVGLIRPITLFPFPEKIIAETAKRVKGMLSAVSYTHLIVNTKRMVSISIRL